MAEQRNRFDGGTTTDRGIVQGLQRETSCPSRRSDGSSPPKMTWLFREGDTPAPNQLRHRKAMEGPRADQPQSQGGPRPPLLLAVDSRPSIGGRAPETCGRKRIALFSVRMCG
jgi:hypothetical protein